MKPKYPSFWLWLGVDTNLSVATAFVAGVLSFLSPCTLPLIPVYLAQMSGVTVRSLPEKKKYTLVFSASLFVLGFTVVFVGLGATGSALGAYFFRHQDLLLKISGTLVILFGFFLLGVLPLPWLHRSTGWKLAWLTRYLGSFGVGFAFALGWTPCIGPILGSILLLASTRSSTGEGIFLLFVYSLGLGIPFLLFSFFFTLFFPFYERVKPYLPWVERASGALLVILGILLLTHRYSLWVNRLLN